MHAPIAPLPFQPRLAPSRYQQAFWLLPMVLALVFVAFIVYAAEVNDAHQHAAFVKTLETDIQSVQAQLGGRQDFEKDKLREIANRLAVHPVVGDAELRAWPEVVAGFDRLWNRLVWIDGDYQVAARAERSVRPAAAQEDLRIQATGQANHIVVPVPAPSNHQRGGQLLARFEFTDLLQSTDLAWLNKRYQVDFLSELGEVIATTASPVQVPRGIAIERPLSVFRDTTLRLTAYAPLDVWHTNHRTVALLLGVLLLGAAASQLIRREMLRVARAVSLAQTEAAWRQSMEDSALVGLRARDHAGRLLYVNKKLCDMVGYRRDELIGLIPPLPFWPADAIPDLMAQNQQALAGAAPTGGSEARWIHRDGHPLDVVIFESPLVDSTGVQIGWMGSIVDISQRKQLEENERRHLEMQAQYARLNDMGLIASELAHELNQPLTAISSYSAGVQLALARALPGDTELLAAVQAMHTHAQKAGEIVNWIRRQSARSEPVRCAAALNAVLSDCLQHRSASIVRASIQLQVEWGNNLPPVWVDTVAIEQAVANLIRNAVDALGQNSGEKHLRIATRYVADAPTPSGAQPMVELMVQDNGPGLAGKSIEALCTTFFSTKAQGMGLGLGICRAIAESHGGVLQAREAPGGGAQFYLLLPAGAHLAATIMKTQGASDAG
jgi:two-component system sensor histidine kinase DctS